MKHTPDKFILAKKSTETFELKYSDYDTMEKYKEELKHLMKWKRNSVLRTKLECEVERVRTWLELNKYLRYAA